MQVSASSRPTANFTTTIQKATKQDIAALSALSVQCAADDTKHPWLESGLRAWSKSQPPWPLRFLMHWEWSHFLKQKKRRILVAKEANKTLGMITVMPYKRVFFQPLIRNYNNTKTAFLESFGVFKTHRNQGIGKQLLKAAEEKAQEQGFKEIIFPCSDKNKPMYEHLGYAPVKNPILKFWLKWPLPSMLALKYFGYPNLMRKALPKEQMA